MISVTIARAVLLGMAILAFLTATVLDGIMMRHFVQPVLRLAEDRTGQAVQPPRPLAFMIQRAWARRLYHLLFAALLLGGWWYLGTDAGVARWARMQQPSR